ncbi:MAG: DUF1330 domain-containing protein [Porticoccaceae bacterium]|nr:DUF1330 domain-containing protein [Porticoccaceae bacterium]
MIYAMNLYDLKEGKEEVYKEYLRRAIEVAGGGDMRPVAAGKLPIKTLNGQQRSNFIVMQFGSLEVFNTLMENAERADIHRLREEATDNYIWTLYENWDLASWIGEKASD